MKIRTMKKGLSFALAAVMLIGMAVPSLKAEAKKNTIGNTNAYYAIESDVKAAGSGTGYHAKLAYVARGAAISYGIQHDEFASAPWTGKDALMVENVYNNNAGGQRYDWICELNPGQTYTLMLTLSKSGSATVYLNGKAMRTYQNDGLKTIDSSDATEYLANPLPRVEGAGRKNGDTVDARFNNITVKEGKYYSTDTYEATNANAREAFPDKEYRFFIPNKVKANPTVNVTNMPKKNAARIYGQISSLPEGMDWDSAYEDVSGIVQWVRNATYFPPKGHKDHI